MNSCTEQHSDRVVVDWNKKKKDKKKERNKRFRIISVCAYMKYNKR